MYLYVALFAYLQARLIHRIQGWQTWQLWELEKVTMHRHLRSPVSVMLCFHSYKANNTPAYKFNNSATSGTHSPIVRPNTKFQQNTTVHGWFTDWTKFSCPSFIFLRGRGRGAWATSSQSWVDRTRPNLVSSLARQVCLRYPVCCSVSKPERLKCQISHFVWPHVKIRGGMGEIFESVFSRVVYAPNAWFPIYVAEFVSKP